MSTESRLARLGLIHLKDKPEELQRRLADMLIEIEAEKTRLRASTSLPAPNESKDGVRQPECSADA
jgi:hypothetical protein